MSVCGLEKCRQIPEPKEDTMSERYQDARRPEFSTLGDSYRMHKQDPDAFVAGAQYVLDKLMSSHGPAVTMGYINEQMADYLDGWAAEILTRAVDGEPQ